MGKSRDTGNLVSANNIFVDIVNDRVGIGSLTPSLKLDVIGSSYISGNLGVGRNNPQQKIENSGAYLTFGQTTANQTSSGSFDFSSGGSARILSWGAVGVNGTISFWTGEGNSGATQKAIINGVGNLGIGSGTPTSRLHVIGDVLISGVTTVTTLVESSSISLKENINPICNTIDKILKLNPVTYNRKDGTSKNEVGLIAEEVDKIIPNIVSRDENGNPSGINYSKLSVYLIDSVKYLTEEILELKNNIKELKNGNS